MSGYHPEVIVVMFGPPDSTLTSVAVRRTEVTIGSDAKADIVIPNAAPQHARLVADGPRWVLVTGAAVTINQREVEGRFLVDGEDEIRIAGYVLAIRPMQLDDREHELLAAAVKDDDARLIYADWLEERGQWDRAEFLRMQYAAKGLDPMSEQFQALSERVRKRALALDVMWRMAVSRDDVKNCRSVTREFTCTMDWSKLEPTSDPTVRSCAGCRKDVFYCTTEDEAAAHARTGDCIVLDISALRMGRLEDAMMRAGQERALVARIENNYGPTAPPGMYLPSTYANPPSTYTAPTTVTCTNCNAAMTTAMRFCSVCGMQR